MQHPLYSWYACSCTTVYVLCSLCMCVRWFESLCKSTIVAFSLSFYDSTSCYTYCVHSNFHRASISWIFISMDFTFLNLQLLAIVYIRTLSVLIVMDRIFKDVCWITNTTNIKPRENWSAGGIFMLSWIVYVCAGLNGAYVCQLLFTIRSICFWKYGNGCLMKSYIGICTYVCVCHLSWD